MKYSESQIEALLDGVYDETIDVHTLPKDLYFAIADYLKSGLYDGFGSELRNLTPGGMDYELLEELRTNVYMFAGAKTYQETGALQSLLFNDEGKLEGRHEFKKKAREVVREYNDTYSEAEYDTTVGQAQMAVRWKYIEQQAAVLPYLRMNVALDERTCPICGPFHGVTLPVGHPFWKKYFPLLHYRCRCTVDQLSEYDAAKITSDKRLKDLTDSADELMNPVFLHNAGIDKQIFTKDHPYFKEIPKADRGRARDNFGLPIPEKDE